MKLSERMAGLLAHIRIDGYCSADGVVNGSTGQALLRRGLIEGPLPHPLPYMAELGWRVMRLSAAGSKYLDDRGVAPTEVRCPHCNGTGRVPPQPPPHKSAS